MSTDAGGRFAGPGGKALAGAVVDDAKALFEAAQAEEEQLSLLEPLTSAEVLAAREEMGPSAGNVAVLAHAREKRRGRPKGSRNRQTDDFARYIGQFGPDPAVVMAQILGETEEEMVERSRLLDPPKRQLTFGDARSMRIRCAENLLPYRHRKLPVAVDMNVRGVIVQEEIGELRPIRGAVIDGEVLGVGDPDAEDAA